MLGEPEAREPHDAGTRGEGEPVAARGVGDGRGARGGSGAYRDIGERGAGAVGDGAVDEPRRLAGGPRGDEHEHGPEDAAARAAGHGENVPPAGRGVNLTPVWAGHNVKFAMPIYEYRCTKCRKRFSQQQAIEEHERRRPACPKCKSRAVEQVFSPFFAKTVRKS